jgi:NAD(P)-dependent dehydrogenase (short-subunit alcohol dehydrogenase family)
VIPDFAFAGDAVVVTGAGRGLGRAYAMFLRERGARVITNDIDADGEVDVVADVSAEAGARLVIARAIEESGRIDAVIANAGTSWHVPFAEMTAEDFDRCVRDNLYSTFHIVRQAWPHMMAQGYGRVVTTSSGGIFGIEGRAHYVAAKGGVLAMSRTLALEGRPHGISVNCILPWGATRLARAGSAAPPAEGAARAAAWLCHRDYRGSGEAFFIGGGRFDRVGSERVAGPPGVDRRSGAEPAR